MDREENLVLPMEVSDLAIQEQEIQDVTPNLRPATSPEAPNHPVICSDPSAFATNRKVLKVFRGTYSQQLIMRPTHYQEQHVLGSLFINRCTQRPSVAKWQSMSNHVSYVHVHLNNPKCAHGCVVEKLHIDNNIYEDIQLETSP